MAFKDVNLCGPLGEYSKEDLNLRAGYAVEGYTKNAANLIKTLIEGFDKELACARDNKNYYLSKTAWLHKQSKADMADLLNLAKKVGKSPTEADVDKVKSLLKSLVSAQGYFESLRGEVLDACEDWDKDSKFRKDLRKEKKYIPSLNYELRFFEFEFGRLDPNDYTMTAEAASADAYVSRAEQVLLQMQKVLQLGKNSAAKKTNKKTGDQSAVNQLAEDIAASLRDDLEKIDSEMSKLSVDSTNARTKRVDGKRKSLGDAVAKAKSMHQAELNYYCGILEEVSQGHKMLRSYEKAMKVLEPSLVKAIKAGADAIKTDKELASKVKKIKDMLSELVDLGEKQNKADIKWEADMLAKLKKLASTGKLSMPSVKIKA